MPTPSPMRMPSARRSNGRIRSLGDSARSSENTLQNVTSCTRCTPPTIMASALPAVRSRTAVSTAIRDDAQAASSVYAGPRRSSRLAMRDAARFGTSPIAASGRSGPSVSVNAARTRASCSAVSVGTSSDSVVTSWVETLTRWSSRATPEAR